jgi:sulfur carrier protein
LITPGTSPARPPAPPLPGYLRDGGRNGSEDAMKIRLQDGTTRVYEGEAARVWEVLLALDLNPAAVIVSRKGRVIPEDTVLGRDEEIRIVRVSHGG